MIDLGNKVSIYEFSQEIASYRFVNSGKYEYDNTTGVYTVTDTANGEIPSFKLAKIGAYDVFRRYDGYDKTLTSKMTVHGEEKTFKIVLDGYGTAKYTFYSYDEDEDYIRERVRTGYYSYSQDENMLVFVAVNEDGQEYAWYVLAVDFEQNAFTILSES